MLRYGQTCRMSRLNQDDVTSVLAIFDPARVSKNPTARSPERDGRDAILGHFYLTDLDGQWHRMSRAHG